MLSSIWDQVINSDSSPTPIEAASTDETPPTTPEVHQSSGSLSSKADKFREAERANQVGKICVVVVFLFFNICFWGIAINEYLRSAEHYIT